MKELSLTVAILLVSMLFCTNALAQKDDTGFSIKGNLEINTDYDIVSDSSGDSDVDENKYDMGGRIKVTPHGKTVTDNFFFEAQADIMANVDSTVSLDDVWGKIGTSTFDIQIGRFEGISLFDKGEDVKMVDAPGAPGRYETNAVRGRLDKPGQIAVHIIPNDVINIEVGTAYGTLVTEDGDETVTENLIGVRPVVAFTFGPMEAAIGMDYQFTSAQNDDAEYDSNLLGFCGKIKATFGPATFGIQYASKTEGKTLADGTENNDVTTNSMGGYTTVVLGTSTLGGGVFYTTSEVDGSNNTLTHTQYHIIFEGLSTEWFTHLGISFKKGWFESSCFF